MSGCSTRPSVSKGSRVTQCFVFIDGGFALQSVCFRVLVYFSTIFIKHCS